MSSSDIGMPYLVIVCPARVGGLIAMYSGSLRFGRVSILRRTAWSLLINRAVHVIRCWST